MGTLIPHFRRERAVLYVDESGQMRGPREADIEEPAVLGSLLMPDQSRDLAALRQLVTRVGEQLGARDLSGRAFKAARRDPTSLGWIASEIRARWFLGFPVVRVTEADVQVFRDISKHLPVVVAESRARLGLKGLALRLATLEGACEEVGRRHPIYLGMLFSLFRDVARWFRRESILPSIRLVLDEKIPKGHRDVPAFLLRFAVSVEYPEVYGGRLGELVGLDPCADFACSISSDDAEDGLKIADIIAFARGSVVRDQDPAGLLAGFLRACSAEAA